MHPLQNTTKFQTNIDITDDFDPNHSRGIVWPVVGGSYILSVSQLQNYTSVSINLSD